MTGGVGDQLDVYLGSKLVGTLERRGPKRYRFQYSDSVLAKYEPGEILLSASLPVQSDEFEPAVSRPFFEGLLPEDRSRIRIAQTLHVSSEDGFALLEELGRDCAGAVVVLPKGASPRIDKGSIKPLTEEELTALIDDLPQHPLGVEGRSTGVRLSLGGVQEKLVLTRSPSGSYGQPLNGAPSTCLLKPEHGDYPDIVANEAFGQRVALSARLDAARAEAVYIGGKPCLYVERFDRDFQGDGRIVRIHQEDMCQALGVSPVDKYEANGGPSVAQIVDLIRDLRAPRAAIDILNVVSAVLLNFLLGNSDAHGKNLALLYEPSSGVRLAPLYDLVSTQVYPGETAMAMSIGGVDNPDEVNLAAWRRLGEACGIGGQLEPLIFERAIRIVQCAEAMAMTAKAEGWHRPVLDQIVALVKSRASQLGP